MTRHAWALFIAFILIGTLLAVWVVWMGRDSTVVEEPVAVAPGELGTFSIYTNGEYGFSLMYPSHAELEQTFSTDHFLSDAWRVNALPTATGTPVLSVVTYQTRSDISYPRYFVAQVRIGASTDPAEVRRCEQAALEQGENQLADVELNGKTFKVFAFQDAGMMQYVRGVSYRTLHEGSCIALEKIQVGSSYRDDAPSVSDISDEALQDEYNALQMIVDSFTFARL